jgi:YVTN family beta-propeller protein
VAECKHCVVRSGTRLGILFVAGAVAVGGALAFARGDDAASSDEPTPARATGSTVPAAATLPEPPPTTTTTAPARPPSSSLQLVKTTTITADQSTGPLSPKSIVASGTGVVYAQNMIYNHSVTAFDADGNHLATIPDRVDLADYGIAGHPPGSVQGGPVELAFSPDRTKAYTSNYSMYGPGFARPGDDTCSPSSGYDSSFVYRIDVATHTIDQVIPVGSVPKYVATTPDGRFVLVTNWCTYDLSVIDAAAGLEVRRLPLEGAYPRGIAVSPDSRTAYVAIMGGSDLVTVDLATFATERIGNVGRGPRHVVISPDGAFLYVTLNKDGQIVKVDAATGAVVAKVATGSAPRSMDIAADGESLYVVNYESSTVSKVTTADMVEVQELATGHHPIGITYDPGTGRVWVACYGGEIEVFDEIPAA